MLIKLVQTFAIPYSVKFTLKPSTLNCFQRLLCSNKATTFNRKTLENDVVLYKYERPMFFMFVNIFSGLQCAVWTYLGYFLHKSLKEEEIREQARRFWKNFINRDFTGSSLSFVTVAFGWAVLFGTSFYTLRSIRKIVLHKGGRNLSIFTHNLTGGSNCIKVPLNNVSAALHRSEAKKIMPLKIGKKRFFYGIDVKGEFVYPNLFDSTIGIKRAI